MHVDKNATLVNIPHEPVDHEVAVENVEAMQAMIDGILQRIHDELPEGKYRDYYDAHQDEFYDWFMDGENDLYPVAAWFSSQGFDEALTDPEVFKQLDL